MLDRWDTTYIQKGFRQQISDSAAVLSRMRAPDVSTRATEADDGVDASPMTIDEGVMLLNWAGALGEGDLVQLDGLARVPPENRFAAGLGSPEDDRQVVEAINRYRPAWEPPMADLADVLAGVEGIAHCSLCLVPLPGREVTEHSEDEWSAFGRELPLARTSAEALRWS